MSEPIKEFWLTGQPNEYDVGIWWDYCPGEKYVVHHVVEKSAYDQALARAEAAEARIKEAEEALGKLEGRESWEYFEKWGKLSITPKSSLD